MKETLIVLGSFFVAWLMLEQFVFGGGLHRLVAGGLRRLLHRVAPFRHEKKAAAPGPEDDGHAAARQEAAGELVPRRRYGEPIGKGGAAQESERKGEPQAEPSGQGPAAAGTEEPSREWRDPAYGRPPAEKPSGERNGGRYGLTVVDDGWGEEAEEEWRDPEILPDPAELYENSLKEAGEVLERLVEGDYGEDESAEEQYLR